MKRRSIIYSLAALPFGRMATAQSMEHRRKAFRGAGGYDADAVTYFAAIVTAGSTISTANKDAVNAFIVGCKADSIWTAIKASCILCASDTRAGAMVPLVGSAPTSTAFVDGDYSRTTGLSSAATGWLNSNRAGDADPQDSMHCAVWATSVTTANYLFGTSTTAAGSTNFGSSAHRINSATTIGSLTVGSGLCGLSRTSSTTVDKANSSAITTGLASTSDGRSTTNHSIFCRNLGSNICTARLSFYSIGESLNLSLLQARLATLMAALT